jgi:hypothetical protein
MRVLDHHSLEYLVLEVVFDSLILFFSIFRSREQDLTDEQSQIESQLQYLLSKEGKTVIFLLPLRLFAFFFGRKNRRQ